MKHCNRWKRAGALLLTAAILGNGSVWSGAGCFTSLAAGGSTTPIAQYDEEAMTKFADNVLEYWEIPGLIEHYNPSYLNQLETFYYNPDGSTGMSREQLVNLEAQLRMEANALEDELEEKLEKKELEKGSDGYQDYKDNIKTLRRYAKEMKNAQDGTASTRRILRIARNQLTVELNAKMREYQSMVSQHEIQKKNREIAEASYNSAKRQADLGMYSASQLSVAENALYAANALTEASAAGLAKAKSDLIVAFGWSADANPEILPVPEPNTAKIAGYKPEVDMEQAINYNYDIVDIRNTDASEYGGTAKKRKELETAENTVKMKLELLHKEVLAKEESYRGALTGFAGAEQKKAQADKKFALGMISRQEYLQAEADWLSAKAAKEQAGFNLTAAMEAYEWAVNGLI